MLPLTPAAAALGSDRSDPTPRLCLRGSDESTLPHGKNQMKYNASELQIVQSHTFCVF